MDRSEAGPPDMGAHPTLQEADSQLRPIASPLTLPASLREGKPTPCGPKARPRQRITPKSRPP
jgi:hypothetical protein